MTEIVLTPTAPVFRGAEEVTQYETTTEGMWWFEVEFKHKLSSPKIGTSCMELRDGVPKRLTRRIFNMEGIYSRPKPTDLSLRSFVWTMTRTLYPSAATGRFNCEEIDNLNMTSVSFPGACAVINTCGNNNCYNPEHLCLSKQFSSGVVEPVREHYIPVKTSPPLESTDRRRNNERAFGPFKRTTYNELYDLVKRYPAEAFEKKLQELGQYLYSVYGVSNNPSEGFLMMDPTTSHLPLWMRPWNIKEDAPIKYGKYEVDTNPVVALHRSRVRLPVPGHLRVSGPRALYWLVFQEVLPPEHDLYIGGRKSLFIPSYAKGVTRPSDSVAPAYFNMNPISYRLMNYPERGSGMGEFRRKNGISSEQVAKWINDGLNPGNSMIGPFDYYSWREASGCPINNERLKERVTDLSDRIIYGSDVSPEEYWAAVGLVPDNKV